MKRSPTLPAKLLRPTQKSTYRRARVFALLDDARPIAWVTGPPGAGKTTLVASYVETRRLRPLWYQLDEGDSDVGTLFYFLRLAAHRIAPRKRWRLPLLTPEYLPGVETFARRWFEELFSKWTEPVLVFDNYHELPANCRLHSVVRVALETLPRDARAVIISRGAPPPALARLRASGSVRSIGWDVLRLTRTETAAIARVRVGRSLPRERARALHSATNGWAAALVLMLERGLRERSSGAGDPTQLQPVFDYLASEFFESADPDVKSVLLCTALLPKVTASLAGRLTNARRAPEILSDLAARRYFTECHPESDPVYRYHPLFREFLLERARRELSEEERRDIQRRAASFLADRDQFEDAAELLHGCGDAAGLAPLIVASAQTLVATGRAATLELWIRALPAETLSRDPWLRYWLAVCRLASSAADAVEHATRAYEEFHRRGDQAGSIASAALAIDAIFYEFSDFHPLDRWVTDLEAFLSNPQKLAFPLRSQAIVALVSALVWRRPEDPTLARWIVEAEGLFAERSAAAFRMRLGSAICQYHTQKGDIARAESVATSIASGEGAADAPPVARIMAMNLQSHTAWIRGDPARSSAIIDEAFALASHHGVMILDPILQATRAFAALIARDIGTARACLARITSSIGGKPAGKLVQYHYLTSWAFMLEHDLEQAHAHAVEAERAARTCGATFAILICKSALAQTLFERGDRISAHTTLAETLELARAIGSSHLEQFALLVDADWAFRERDISRGFGSLRTAFELGREHGFLACGWWRPEVIAGLCTRALEGGVEVDYARRLVRAHRLRPDPALPAPEAWPWPIRIRALGGFEIEVNDSPVVAMGKAQRKPIALLKVVIALGHPAVREREVADALWPEAEGDAAQQSLAVTLHRLRRLLGDDGAVRRHEGRLELDPSRAWSDVAALASILERTARATGEERAGLLGSGLQLYRGPLLADDDEAWTVEPRERLRGRLVREVAEVARSYESSDPDRAVNWYLKALDADPRAEGVYRRLIALYERLGRRAEALAVYERCDATLRASLGVNPSRDTEAIVRALRSSS